MNRIQISAPGFQPATFRRLDAFDGSALEQIRAIYESNFPAAERKPFANIAQRLKAEEYLCFVAKSQESIVAFALLLPLPNTDATFLEYIAVDKAHHSQGLGIGLLRFIMGELETSLIWEVEPPLNTDPDDIRNRRLRFYERLGGQLIALSAIYEMPNFEAGSDGVPLRLMQFPAGEQPASHEIRAIIHDIYAVAYPDWNDLRNGILQQLGEPAA